MARLAAGEREAFDRVYAILWPALRAFALKLTGHATDAEDIAQEALVKVFARVSEYDRSRDALTWAFAITAFEIKTIRRRYQRRRETDIAEANHATSPTRSPEEVVLNGELAKMLAAALADLSPDDATEVRRYLEAEAGNQPAMDAAGRKRRQRALGRLKLVWRTLNGFHS